MGDLVEQATRNIVGTAPVALVSGGTNGRVRITLNNLGPFGIRIGGDASIAYEPVANGFTLPPGTTQSIEQDGMKGVFAIAPPGVGETTVPPCTVDLIVEKLTDDPTDRMVYGS